MKNLTFIALLFIFSPGVRSQILERETFHQKVSLPTSNDAVRPCITLQQYESLNRECAQNRKQLPLQTITHRDINTPALTWPLRAASGFTDCEFYFIGAYVDQNTALLQLSIITVKTIPTTVITAPISRSDRMVSIKWTIV